MAFLAKNRSKRSRKLQGDKISCRCGMGAKRQGPQKSWTRKVEKIVYFMSEVSQSHQIG